MLTWEVTKEDSGITLLAFLKGKLGENYSGKRLKKALDDNLCLVNGLTQRFASTILGVGDRVQFSGETASSPTPSIDFDPARLLFEDQDLFIYNKPPGIASDSVDLLNALQRNRQPLILVHRLDRETSGVLIFAKSKQIFTKFVELFKKRLINKVYLALVDGIPNKRSGYIENFLGEQHRYQGQALYGAVEPKKGLLAITAWECDKTGKKAALLRCFPKTGRTHQIRVHCSEMGHPILGDFQYGRRFDCTYRPSRCLLHASSIAFPHPATGQTLEVMAPLPADFAEAIKSVISS